ncbi:MAG: hypothetical protein JWO36_3508 [Myxococcales bacterium]|nr:hypothetical protein [Myxococcales bacterium]
MRRTASPAYDRGLRDRLARLAFERGFLIGLVVLVAYLWLAPAHIVAADNAEFATLGDIGGRAHPSGYPLYVLWLRAMSWLPAASAAHRAALATSFLAAVQVVVLHAACRAWGARPSAATFTVAIFAAAPIVLRVHTEADVFALNSLVASVILWLAAAEGPVRGTMRCTLLGLAAGLGLANNLTCALLAPIGLLGILRGMREASSMLRSAAAALGSFAIGLAPYVYLFVAPDPASWAPVNTLGDLLDTFLRRDYGYTSHLPSGARIPLSTSLAAHAALIGRIWLWFPAVLGLAILGRNCVKSSDRWGWWMLALSWLIVGPLFASQLGVDPRGVGGYIGGRMQILSAVVFAVPIACGFDLIARRLQRPLAPRIVSALAIVGFVALAFLAYPRLQRLHSSVVEVGVRNMLRSLPQDAIVIVVSEDQCFGARYLQLVSGERRDVAVVCWTLTTRDWYRGRLSRAGVTIAPSRGGVATVAQAEALIATGRPLFVDDAQTDILAQLPSYPVGVLLRVLPRGVPTPSLGEVVENNRTIYAAFDFDYPRPTRDDDFAAVAHFRYAHPWRVLAKQLEAAGDGSGAAAANELAQELRPIE